MKLLSSLLLMLLVIIFSCNDAEKKTTTTTTDTSKAQADTLMSEVMDGHDVGMAKYGRLKAAEKRVEAIIDSLEKVKGQTASLLKPRMDSLLSDIRSAKQEMDVWMETFNMDSAVNDMRARIRYLTDEKIKVNKMKDNILNVLQKTDSLVRNKLD